MHVWFTADGILAESLVILPGQEGWKVLWGAAPRPSLSCFSLFPERLSWDRLTSPPPFWGGVGLSASPLEIEWQGVKTLNCSSELAHQVKIIPQVMLQLSGPSCFECSAFLVCSRKILGRWHLWFTRLFPAHVSYKLPATTSGSLYLYPLNQSDLSLELDLSCVCLRVVPLYQGGEVVEGLAGVENISL